MKHSIVSKQECAKYDFGHLLVSPGFYMREKLANWELLDGQSSKSVGDYFLHVKDTVHETEQQAICYDLTDGLPKFLDGGVVVDHIRSTKKVAREGDFVISRLRSYLEEMAIVEGKKQPQLFSSEFLVFRKKTEELSVETLFAVCMTSIVQVILGQGQYGTEHPRFYDFLLTNLPIPDCLQTLDGKIKNLVQQAVGHRVHARKMYADTQRALLSELGLANWQSKQQISFAKNYSDTESAGRIDADYFQPKYEKISNAIKSCKGGWDVLSNLVTIEKSVEVGSAEYLDAGIPFVRVSNLNPFEITEEKYISKELYAEIKQHQPNMGEILLSKDGTPGIAHYLHEQPKKMIPSGGILRLKSKKTGKVNGEYLALVLNSVLTKEQVERDVGGSVILHWRPEQVKNLLIPILPKGKQTAIQEKIVKSSGLRARSKHLLNCAKTAVELAMEKDEKAAMRWLKDNAGKAPA